MCAAVFIACRQLLKNIHVPYLQMVGSRCLITKPNKKAVLVEIIVHDLFSKVYMHFIIGNKRKTIGHNAFAAQWHLQHKIVTQPEVECIAIGQSRIVQYLSPVSFFQPHPLHDPFVAVFGMPLQLLPGPVFGL